MNTCPLCHSTDLVAYHQDKRRCYQQCQRCALVSVPAEFYLSSEAEKAEYRRRRWQEDPGQMAGKRRAKRAAGQGRAQGAELQYRAEKEEVKRWG